MIGRLSTLDVEFPILQKGFMKHIYQLLPEQKELIKEYEEQDLDFRKLCADYERIIKMIKYFTNLVDVPLNEIEKQIRDQEELKNELEEEIRLFLNKINSNNSI